MNDKPIYNSLTDEDVSKNIIPPKNILVHPWRRYLARLFDVGIYNVLLTLVLIYAFRINTDGSKWAQFLEMVVVLIIMLVIEPVLLSRLGTTPGKWILGLKLRNLDGSKLTYKQGFWRTAYIIQEVYGFNIPLYNLYRHYKSYRACVDNEQLSWDYGYTYELKDTKGIRSAGYLCAMAVFIGLAVILINHAKLPIHRGDISAEEYYDNCNDLAAIHNLEYGKHLNEEGY